MIARAQSCLVSRTFDSPEHALLSPLFRKIPTFAKRGRMWATLEMWATWGVLKLRIAEEPIS